MIKSYLKGSHAVMLVYDVTHAQSFSNLERWMEFVQEVFQGDKHPPYLALIGNKSLFRVSPACHHAVVFHSDS
jgi:GTPase SAR1 family protein